MKRLRMLGVLAFVAATSLPAAAFDITTFGAKGDGKTQNRAAINKAIEAAAAAGGWSAALPLHADTDSARAAAIARCTLFIASPVFPQRS